MSSYIFTFIIYYLYIIIVIIIAITYYLYFILREHISIYNLKKMIHLFWLPYLARAVIKFGAENKTQRSIFKVYKF